MTRFSISRRLAAWFSSSRIWDYLSTPAAKRRPTPRGGVKLRVEQLELREMLSTVMLGHEFSTETSIPYNSYTKTITLDQTIDPTKSIIIGSDYNGADYSANALARFQFGSNTASTNQLTLNRSGNGGNAMDGNLVEDLSVLSFASGVSVQHKQVTFTGTAQDVSISSVNAGMSIVLVSATPNAADGQNVDSRWQVAATLTSGTNVHLVRGDGGSTANVNLQIITFDSDSGVTIQKGTTALTGATSTPVSYTASTSGDLLFFNSSVSSAVGAEGLYQITGKLSGGQVQFNRAASGAQVNVNYAVVSIPGATVQSGETNFAAETSEGSTTAPVPQNLIHYANVSLAGNVNLNNSFVYVNGSRGGTATAIDKLGDTNFAAKLTSSSAILLERGDRPDTTSDAVSQEIAATADWSVVSLPSSFVTTTTLATPTTITYGNQATFTANVTSTLGIPTGLVTFKDGTNPLGNGTLNSSGIATFTTTALLTAGTHSITAVYNGDYGFTGSTSSAGTQVVTVPVRFDVSSSSVYETNGSAVVTVDLGQVSNQAVTIHYATSDGSATAGTNYTSTSGTLTIAAGQLSGSFTIPILNNHATGAYRATVNLTLSSPNSYGVLGSPSTAILNIDDLTWVSNPTYTWTQTAAAAPVITALGDQTNAEGDTPTLSISASAPPNTTLSYSAVNLPVGLSINSSSGVVSGSVDYQAAEDFGGLYPVTVIVATSQGGSATTSFNWTINDTPRLPVLTNPGNQSTSAGAAVSLQISASQSDGDPLSYDVTGLPIGLSIDSDTGLISGTVDPSAASTTPYSITVTATDYTPATPQVATQTFSLAVGYGTACAEHRQSRRSNQCRR